MGTIDSIRAGLVFWFDYPQTLPFLPAGRPTGGRFMVALALGIPIGAVFQGISRDPWLLQDSQKVAAIQRRHAFCAAIGISLMIFLYGCDTLHACFSSAVAFCLIRFLPKSHVHIGVSIWAMGFVCLARISRMIVDYGGSTVDFTTPQLLLTQKFMNIAFALHDSSRDPTQLTKDNQQSMIATAPSPIEFVGYLFCLHTPLAGPTIDYKEYLAFIDGSNRRGFHAPAVWAVLGKVTLSMFALALFLCVNPRLPISLLGEKEWLEASPIWLVFAVNQAVLLAVRHRLYAVWFLADAGANAAGLGFQKTTVGDSDASSYDWGAVQNADYTAVELATNLRQAIAGWNINTTKWLRRCIYEHAPPGMELALTFGVCALWHGFYPGYYLAALNCTLFLSAARQLRKHLRPRVPMPQHAGAALLYHVSSTALTFVSINYATAPFFLLTMDSSLHYMARVHFAPTLIAAMLWLALRARTPPAPARQDRADRRD